MSNVRNVFEAILKYGHDEDFNPEEAVGDFGRARFWGRGHLSWWDMVGITGNFGGGVRSGGGNQHGLGRALVHGYIAGGSIAREKA